MEKMSKEQFEEFLWDFKKLFEDGMSLVLDDYIGDVLQDILDTLRINADLNISWREEFDCHQYFFQLKNQEDKEGFIDLADELKCLLDNGVVIVKDYPVYSAISEVLGRCGFEHTVTRDTNFDDEDIWVVSLIKEVA